MSSGFSNGFGVVKNLTTRIKESVWCGSENIITVTQIGFRWEIPDFFPIEEVKEEKIISPEFESFGAKWHIYLQKKQSSYEFCEMFIGKNEIGSDMWVYYTIGIKRKNGTIYKSVKGKIYLGYLSPGSDVISLKHFIPMMACYSECYNTGKKLILLSSDLHRDEMELSSENALVVFCNFFLKEKRSERIISNSREQEEENYISKFNFNS